MYWGCDLHNGWARSFVRVFMRPCGKIGGLWLLPWNLIKKKLLEVSCDYAWAMELILSLGIINILHAYTEQLTHQHRRLWLVGSHRLMLIRMWRWTCTYTRALRSCIRRSDYTNVGRSHQRAGEAWTCIMGVPVTLRQHSRVLYLDPVDLYVSHS